MPFTLVVASPPLMDNIATPAIARIMANHVAIEGFSLKMKNIRNVTKTG